MTNNYPFDTEAQFRALIPLWVNDICFYQMPHALQVVREFWLRGGKPYKLETYLRSPSVGQTTVADTFHACGPGNVATLDPHLIQTVVSKF
jgi:hypothetical protein